MQQGLRVWPSAAHPLHRRQPPWMGLKPVIDQLRAILRQPEIMAGATRAAKGHHAAISEDEARAALTALDPLWDELFPAKQARIVQLLVERVDIGIDGLDIRMRLDGMASLASEMRQAA